MYVKMAQRWSYGWMFSFPQGKVKIFDESDNFAFQLLLVNKLMLQDFLC